MAEIEKPLAGMNSQIANIDRGTEFDARFSYAPFETLLTEEQLAERHQRSVKTIRNLRVKGGYVPFLKIGRHVRYRLKDILAYENSCVRESTSDARGNDNGR